ncbi:MAG: hypothetical protein K0Q49_2498 [Haloplasmataceae bacterium]|jgi:hypothetical protein|nr:hypothetical protein [Haloplasmataceae bacterium]
MKCINCKKDIIDGSSFCIYCGEKLSNNDNFNNENNNTVDNQGIYDGLSSTVAECGTAVKNNLPGYYEKIKTFVAKNKLASIIGAIVMAAIILGVGIFSFMEGRPVKEDQLKNYLVGQNLMLDGAPFEIKSEQIKALTITSRNSVKKQSDKVEGSITLDFDNSTVEANVKFDLFYDKNNNKWIFNGLKSSDIKSVEPKVELKDNINDLIKNSTVNYDFKSIDLKKGLLKEIGNVEIKGSGLNRTGTAALTLSNGVVEAKVSTDFDARFSLKDGKWLLKSDYLRGKVIDKEKISSNLSDDDKKKFVLTAFDNDRSYNYKYKIGSFDYVESIYLNKDNISDLKINNFMEDKDDSIRVEIEGQAASGDISKIKFSGVAYLSLSLDKNYNNNIEVTVDSVEVANINLDAIKKNLLDFKLDSKQITVAVADTFTLGTENKDSRIFDKVYDGTITSNGEVKNIKTYIDLAYNRKTKKYEWKLDNMDIVKK